MAKNVTLKRVNNTSGATDDLHPTTDWGQIESKPSTFTPTSHTHGNITDGGEITASATIATGDHLVIADNSSGNDLTTSSITFDTSNTTQFLRKDGTFATPAGVDNYVNISGDTMTGDLSFTNATDIGVQNASGNSWYRPEDQYGNTHIEVRSGKGIYVDADTVAFRSQANTDRMRITSSGNVGIGTTTPSELLEVEGSGTTRLAVTSTGGATLKFKAASGNAYISTSTNDNIIFQINDTSQHIFNTAGNVGIGTTAPSDKLEVVGNVRANRFTDRTNTSYYVDPASTSILYNIDVQNTTTTRGSVVVDTDTNQNLFYISRTGSTSQEYTSFGRDDTTTHIHTKNDESSSTIRFRIENTDTESGGGANANDRNIDFISDATRAQIQIAGQRVATESYVDTEIASLVDTAPEALNTLNELAAALGDDPSFATTVTNSIATKLPLTGGTLTGTLTSRSINMQNYTLSNVGQMTFNDPGPNEGISWSGGNFSIYESPNDLSTNSAGNLQFVSGGSRRLTVQTDGTVYVPGTLKTEKLEVEGAIFDVETNSLRMPMVKGGHYNTDTSSVTGAIAITLPSGTYANATMMNFFVDVFDYAGASDGESFTLHIGGYNYTDGTFHNVFANLISGRNDRFFTVRFNYDSANSANIIYIGETTSNWAYPKVTIRDFSAGHAGADDVDWYNNAFNISFATTLLGTTSRSKTAENVASNSLQLGGVNASSYLRSDTADTASGDITFTGNIVADLRIKLNTPDNNIAPLNIKSDAEAQAIHIEETGTGNSESWQIGVNGDGDLNFYNSGSATPTIQFYDSNSVFFPENVTMKNLQMTSNQNRTKLRVWSGSTYGMGMHSGFTYGGLGDYAMTFQMNDDLDRGFWWGHSVHTTAQGAMALTTDGELTVANAIRVGYGEADTTTPADNVFDINGNVTIAKVSSGGQNQIKFQEVGTTKTQITSNYGDDKFYLYHEGDNRMVIDSSGRIGIGTASPSTKMHISESGTTTALTVQNASSNGTVVKLTSTGDNRNLYLQTDHIYSNGNLYFGDNSYETIIRGSDVKIENEILHTKTSYGEPNTENFYRIKLQDQGGVHNDVGIGQTTSGNMGYNVTAANAHIFFEGTNGEIARLQPSGLALNHSGTGTVESKSITFTSQTAGTDVVRVLKTTSGGNLDFNAGAVSLNGNGNITAKGNLYLNNDNTNTDTFVYFGDSGSDTDHYVSFDTSEQKFNFSNDILVNGSAIGGGGVTSIKNFSGPYVNTNGFTAKQLPLSKTLSTGDRIGLSVIVGTTTNYGTRTQQTVWLEVGTSSHAVLFAYYDNSTSTMRLYSAEVYISSGNLYIDDAVAWTDGAFGHSGSSTTAIYVMDVLEYA